VPLLIHNGIHVSCILDAQKGPADFCFKKKGAAAATVNKTSVTAFALTASPSPMVKRVHCVVILLAPLITQLGPVRKGAWDQFDHGDSDPEPRA
jgi:hypothetical protein